MKERASIVSVSRSGHSSAWRIGIYVNSNFSFVVVGGRSNVSVSPRFNNFLNKINEATVRYPVEVNFQHLADGREMEATVLNGKVIYLDCGFTLEKAVGVARFTYSDQVASNPLFSSSASMNSNNRFSVEEIIPENGSYVAYGVRTNVIDGDSIDVRIVHTTELLSSHGVSEGSTISVRYNGADAPEIADTNRGRERNSQIARAWMVELQDVFSIARESRDKNISLLGNENNLIILHFDRYQEGDAPRMDVSDNRYICDVYGTRAREATALTEQIRRGNSFTHIPKTLLVTNSAVHTHVPLAFLMHMFVVGGNSILNAFPWATELGIQIFDLSSGAVAPDISIDVNEEEQGRSSHEVPPMFRRGENIIEFIDQGPQNNALDFFEPYDDRASKFGDKIADLDEFRISSLTRIGDTFLTIPPLAIHVDRQASIERIRSLRTKQSTLVNTGRTVTTIQIELYFHDCDSINGIEIPRGGEGNETFAVDGLRPLLAQFAKCPFLPIDSYYFNHVLDIHEVALVNMEVTTVPNFPESLSATMTLVDFNSTPYLLEHPNISSSINYPMMRWYYNQSLTNRGPRYRYFKEINRQLSNDITFSIASGDFLEQRQQAMAALQKMKHPDTFRQEIESRDDYQTKVADNENLDQIELMIERYNELRLGNNAVIGTSAIVRAQQVQIRSALQEKHGVSTDRARMATDMAPEHFMSIYNGMTSVNNIFQTDNVFIPFEASPFFSVRLGLRAGAFGTNIASFVDYSQAPYAGLEEHGVVIMRFTDTRNEESMRRNLGQFWNASRNAYIVPATRANLNAIRSIRATLSEVESAADSYEETYNMYLRIVDVSENGVPMDNFEIGGTFIPTSISASFENQFSVINTIQSPVPNLQFMGGGDPTLTIHAEMDEVAARDFANLLAISDDYVKRFNRGISNGFIGIQNDIAQLYGINTVMFENVTFSTVPNYPGRIAVDIRAVGFDKTQRQRERLVNILGAADNMTREMLRQAKFSFANDRLMEARLLNLEVYPDLELPTYGEVNAALPTMDTGGCTEYLNRTAGLYVDPDFYYSTKVTNRMIVEKYHNENHQLNMYDETGVSAVSSSANTTSMFDTTPANWEKLKAVEETEYVKPLGWQFSWGDEEGNATEETRNAGAPVASVELSGAEITNMHTRNFLSSSDFQFPTSSEWNRLFSGRNSYPGAANDFNEMQENPNPSEEEVNFFLSQALDRHFGSDMTNQNAIWNARGEVSRLSTRQRQQSYCTPQEMYEGSFHAFAGTLGSALIQRQLNSKIKEGLVEEPGTNRTSQTNFRKERHRPQKERMMMLIKSFLSVVSGWKHFANGRPNIRANGSRIGIGQMDISRATREEAQRLMFNWKYNIEQMVISLHREFKRSEAMRSDLLFHETSSRPWDTMFVMYNNRGQAVQRNTDIEGDAVFRAVDSTTRFYAENPSHTHSGFNINVHNRYAGMEEELRNVATGSLNKEEIVNKLIELEYIHAQTILDAGFDISVNYSEVTGIMRQYLNEQDIYWLNNLLRTWASQLHAWESAVRVRRLANLAADLLGSLPATGQLASWLKRAPIAALRELAGASHEAPNGRRIPYEVLQRGALYYEAIMSTQQREQEETNTLINDTDPHTLYREMYHDMRYFDMRGRMARAFPAYQMFIVQEGEWIGRHKFWDNMFGFNAIDSIDIHRSRKIAADTAIISMNNVYSNLTTRRTDVDFKDRELSWWNNILWRQIPDSLIEKRQNESHKTLWLETGARVHVRLGYGSNARELPVVFNGTITELDVGDVVTAVCQGDGIQLGNVISGDPNDDNNGLFNVEEPRDLICRLMSSKGSWWKDFMNNLTDGWLFQDNPLGIMHFGLPFDSRDGDVSQPLGNLLWFNCNYGEVAQNIYSQNGTPTFSQWLHPDGSRNNIFNDFSWSRLWENKFKLFNPGDEDNIVLNFYNQTVWDIVQTITMCTPDYIATVLPFELRSSLFFGKPYWRCAFGYDARYTWDEENSTWAREVIAEQRRPYMQFKVYNGYQDIISNNIRASEDTLFTNAVVNYDGKQTPVIYADANIRYDKQRTRAIEANIVSRSFGINYWTAAHQAITFGASAIKDSLQDMYKGHVLVVGDPTVKPYDMMYVQDDVVQLNGTCMVKAITHHFSLETGFVTAVEPDVVASIDDGVLMEITRWGSSFNRQMAIYATSRIAANYAAKKVTTWMWRGFKNSGILDWASGTALKGIKAASGSSHAVLSKAGQAIDDLVRYGKSSTVTSLYDDMIRAMRAIPDIPVKSGAGVATKVTARTASILKGSTIGLTRGAVGGGIHLTKVAKAIGISNPLTMIPTLAIWIGTETIFEHFRRNTELLNSVQIMPLTYQGQPLIAGLTGHGGLIYGDAPGDLTALYTANWGDNYDHTPDGFLAGVFKTRNLLMGIRGRPGFYSHEDAKELDDLIAHARQWQIDMGD